MTSIGAHPDLIIRIVELKFSKNQKMMEPYVVVKTDGTRFKTSVYKGQDKGVRGYWNESTTVKTGANGVNITFEVWDDNVFSDELLAVLSISVQTPNNITQNYRLLDKKSQHLGDLFINFSFSGQAAGQSTTLYGTSAVTAATTNSGIVTSQPIPGTLQHATAQTSQYHTGYQQTTTPPYQQQKVYNPAAYQPPTNQSGVYNPNAGVYTPGVPPSGVYSPQQQYNQYQQPQQNNAYPPQQNNAYPPQQNNAYPSQQNNPYPPQQNNTYPSQQQNNTYPSQQQNNTYPQQQAQSPSNYGPPSSTAYPTNSNAYPTPPGQQNTAYPTNSNAYPTPPGQQNTAYPTNSNAYPTPPGQHQQPQQQQQYAPY